MSILKEKFNLEELKVINDYQKAIIIVFQMFTGKVDKEGAPYINHLLYVSNHVDTEEAKVVGLLHDLVEDTDATFEELEEAGFSKGVIDALKLVTRDKKYSYLEYINNILNSNNLTVLKVKISDMEHNMDPKRLAKLDEATRNRLANKYAEPYEKLKRKIGELEYDRHKTNKRK